MPTRIRWRETPAKETPINETRINEQLRARRVRLIGPDGTQVGVVAYPNALDLATTANLDLVEVAPDADPPVCKIMDYGRYVFEQKQKTRNAKKTSRTSVVKEMKFRPKIGHHDLLTKTGHVRRFLEAGDKVRLTIMFRGREQRRPETGQELLAKIADMLSDVSRIEQEPLLDGRNMLMTLVPDRKKSS